MPLPKVADIRELSDQALVDEILAVKKQMFDLRFQKATRREVKSHEFKHARHRLAQLLTVERERQLQGAEDENGSSISSSDSESRAEE